MSRFNYPQLCCRCAASEPATTWGVQSYETKPGPGSSTVSITYTCPVPVCSACQRSLNCLWCLSWFAGLSVGAASGWFIYQWAIGRPHADTYPELLMRGVPILLGGLIAWGCAWLLKAIFINYDFVHFDPDEQTMVFKNQAYQQQFNDLNNLGMR